MSRKLAAVLKTDSLKPLAQILRSKGRRGDTILAHITPKEAALLKRRGGSGTINPDTGLPEFFGEEGFDFSSFEAPIAAPVETPVETPVIEAPVQTPVVENYGQTPFQTNVTEAPGGFPYQGNYDPRADLPMENAIPVSGTSQNFFERTFGNTPISQIFGGQEGTVRATDGTPLPPIRDLSAEESAQRYVESGIPAEVKPLSEEVTKAEGGFLDKLGTSDLLKLGIGGLGALMGRSQQMQALKQAQALQAQYAANAAAAAKQQRELAAPLLGPGYTALGQAQQGALTAANQQAFQAMQARLAQSQARSGGVGAIQTAVAEEAARQQALANQVNQAMALIGPGNTLANQSIQTNLLGQQGGLQLGISLSQAANQAAMNMYGALAKFAVG